MASMTARVDLLDAEGDLTPQFSDALAFIFQKYCSVPSSLTHNSDADDSESARSGDSSVNARSASAALGSEPPTGAVLTDEALDRFAIDTNGARFPEESKEELRQLLDCDAAGRLTFSGFVGMYHLQTDNDEEETWKDLKAHGFSESLQLLRQTSREKEVKGQSIDQSEDMTRTASPPELLKDLHVKHILKLSSNVNSLSYHLSTHLRMNGVFWGLGALDLMRCSNQLPTEDLVRFVRSCWDQRTGGFGSFPRHDPHILSTLSAIQILAIKGQLDILEKEKVIQFILSLRNPVSKLFFGDHSRLEEDSRFLYCAVNALALLGSLHRLDRQEAIDGIMSCHNFDGGFGRVKGSESHAGQAFVCVGTLCILDALPTGLQEAHATASGLDVDQLASWLSERQTSGGGLNGRPQKLEDVCYSWWVLTALSMLKRLHWINATKLIKFILAAQDPDLGGIADRPDNVADVFHTFFGLAGLSLLGYPGLRAIDPVYAMPEEVTKSLGIQRDYQRMHNSKT